MTPVNPRGVLAVACNYQIHGATTRFHDEAQTCEDFAKLDDLASSAEWISRGRPRGTQTWRCFYLAGRSHRRPHCHRGGCRGHTGRRLAAWPLASSRPGATSRTMNRRLHLHGRLNPRLSGHLLWTPCHTLHFGLSVAGRLSKRRSALSALTSLPLPCALQHTTSLAPSCVAATAAGSPACSLPCRNQPPPLRK